jgi:hypothetical protein
VSPHRLGKLFFALASKLGSSCHRRGLETEVGVRQ